MTGTGELALSLAEVKAYLRVNISDDDAALAAMMRSAQELCEGFLGEALMQRSFAEELPVSSSWRRLCKTPVLSIDGVTGIPAEGAEFALAVDAYAIDIDRNGDGWIRLLRPGSAGRVRVEYMAGLAATPSDLPEPVRHGLIRMTEHLYNSSPGDAAAAIPASVGALWRHYRRMRLC